MNEGFLLTGEELDAGAIWGGTLAQDGPLNISALLMRSKKRPLWNNKVIFTLCRKKIRVSPHKYRSLKCPIGSVCWCRTPLTEERSLGEPPDWLPCGSSIIISAAVVLEELCVLLLFNYRLLSQTVDDECCCYSQNMKHSSGGFFGFLCPNNIES